MDGKTEDGRREMIITEWKGGSECDAELMLIYCNEIVENAAAC
jgi:hypothetical protein